MKLVVGAVTNPKSYSDGVLMHELLALELLSSDEFSISHTFIDIKAGMVLFGDV